MNRLETMENKTGIVTGAGSGMGQQVALLAVARGATVFALDINENGLADTRRRAADLPGTVVIIPCDVSSEDSVQFAVEGARQVEGTLDFLVNAAGIEDAGQPVHELSVAHWDRLMGINLRGVFLIMRAVLPTMRAQRAGSIVNMGSVASLLGMAELGAYASSKHGILGLSRVAVAENAPYNVRINTVCPGPIDTPLQDRAEAGSVNPAEFRARQEAAIPQRRYGTGVEVADLIIFLCSDRAQYINGATIPIDGGMSATR